MGLGRPGQMPLMQGGLRPDFNDPQFHYGGTGMGGGGLPTQQQDLEMFGPELAGAIHSQMPQQGPVDPQQQLAALDQLTAPPSRPLNTQADIEAALSAKQTQQAAQQSDGLDAVLGGDQGGGGIGLQNTLGILNLGAGLGSQIYKFATASKPKRPKRNIPMPGGNPMRG